jgi:hypothetical protein
MRQFFFKCAREMYGKTSLKDCKVNVILFKVRPALLLAGELYAWANMEFTFRRF